MEFKNFFEASINGDLELLHAYADKDIPIRDIGRPKSSLYRLLDKYGIKRSRRLKTDPEIVHRLRDGGHSVKEIAAYFQCSPRRINQILSQPPSE